MCLVYVVTSQRNVIIFMLLNHNRYLVLDVTVLHYMYTYIIIQGTENLLAACCNSSSVSA